jgi:hypothetical protein
MDKQSLEAFTVKAAEVLKREGLPLDLITEVLDVEVQQGKTSAHCDPTLKPYYYFNYKKRTYMEPEDFSGLLVQILADNLDIENASKVVDEYFTKA